MKRGPKPIDPFQLRDAASRLALALYRLRDGAPGLLRHAKGGVWKTRLLAEIPEDEVGRPEKTRQRILAKQVRYIPLRYRVTTLVVPPTEEARNDVLELVKRNKNWNFTPPVAPRPEIWERLKKARSVDEVRQIAHRVRHEPLLAAILYSRAKDFLRAQRLHNYPKSKRPHSDNKRILFFAKSLAGLQLGIAPATATRRLPHVCLPDSVAQAYSEVFSPMYSVLFKGRQQTEK